MAMICAFTACDGEGDETDVNDTVESAADTTTEPDDEPESPKDTEPEEETEADFYDDGIKDDIIGDVF